MVSAAAARRRDGVDSCGAATHRTSVRGDSRGGFTLIELMIGLAIAAFLVTMALPSFSEFLRNSEVRSTSESIVNGLRLARSEAANRNQAVTFALAGGGSPGWNINASDGSLIQSYSRQEGGSNTAVAILPPNAIAVTFNGLGRIASPATGAPPNLGQIDVSSAIASDARSLRIYVDDAHGVRLCDPSPALAAIVPRDARAC